VVNPGDVLTILVRFEGYTGRYVFHCHMLEHEDNDMMRPYEVVPGDAEASKG
jgi:spore coat protein A, manganese oxidase